MQYKKEIALIGTILVGVIAYFGLSYNQLKQAPDVSLALINEDPTSLSDLHVDQPVLVVFWATDCVPCLKEVPMLIRLYKRYHPEGLNIVAVAMAHDPPNKVWNFVRDKALPYKVALDMDNKIAMAFGGVSSIPTLFLINGNGDIVFDHIGKLKTQALETLIQELVETNPA